MRIIRESNHVLMAMEEKISLDDLLIVIFHLESKQVINEKFQ